jgi:hypothetical protein
LTAWSALIERVTVGREAGAAAEAAAGIESSAARTATEREIRMSM